MDAVEQLVDRSKDFVNAALLDQLGRYLIVQKSLAREEPSTCVVRLVDVRELVDDEFELEIITRMRHLVHSHSRAGPQPASLSRIASITPL